MTTLTGRTPKDTYKDLLQVSNANKGIDTTLRHLEDGEGTQSPLRLSTTRTDSYLPQSAVGTVISGNIPGITTSSSRGTEATPLALNSGDILGGFESFGYTGPSPAYTPMAAIYTKVNGVTTSKGADIVFALKADNFSPLFDKFMIRNDGFLFSPPGTGNYNFQGILVSTPSGPFLSGALNIQDPGYFIGDASSQLLFNNSTNGISSASGLKSGSAYNSTLLTINDGFAFGGGGYVGIYQYAIPGASSYALIDFDTTNPSYLLTDRGYIKSNDPVGSRLGNVFGPNGSSSVGADGTVNIYQEGGGSYWQLWLDKSDVIRGSYTDSLLDVMDASFNTNKNVFCLNLQAANTIIAASGVISGAWQAGNLTATASVELLNATSRMYIKEGTNGSSGTATLVAGVATITINGMSTSSRAFVELVTPGGTIGTGGRKVVCTANTLTITSISILGATQTLDTSTIRYWFFNAT